MADVVVNKVMKNVSGVTITRYSSKSTSSKKDGTLASNGTFTATKQDGNWFYDSANTGWYCNYMGNNKYCLANMSGSTGTSQSKADQTEEAKIKAAIATESKWSPQIDYYANYSSNTSSKARFKEMSGVYGMPPTYLDSVDLPLNKFDKNMVGDFNYGREYTERILINMPLLVMTPGAPAFMEGFSKKDKNITISQILGVGAGNESDLQNLLGNKTGRYYTFRFKYKEYYSFVNPMAQTLAQFLNLGKDEKGVSYSSKDWSRETENSGIKGFFSGMEYVCFYMESENQVTESFSNSTGESLLDSTMNKMSDMAKEIDTLLGAGLGYKAQILNEDAYTANLNEINKYLGTDKNPSALIERLKTGALTVAAGGQLIFPEIWKDSSYSKSYDVTIKLIASDGSDETIYNELLVPVCHLLGFVLPMQLGYNGYRSPFLVRAFSKGIFSVDMGIVTSMSIRKGAEAAWNINGLPTEIEVNLTIKDLYEVLCMTTSSDASMFINNTAMMDFLANLSGININKPELFRKIDMLLTTKFSSIKNIPRGMWVQFNENISNTLRSAFGFK